MIVWHSELIRKTMYSCGIILIVLLHDKEYNNLFPTKLHYNHKLTYPKVMIHTCKFCHYWSAESTFKTKLFYYLSLITMNYFNKHTIVLGEILSL